MSTLHSSPSSDLLPPPRLAWTVWGLGALLYFVAFYQRVAPAVLTDRLMADFALGGAALGNLSAFYFYTYVAMQVPTGILADRWGPRRLLTLGAGVATVGTALFAWAPTLAWAGAGRLLIGASVAVAFVCMMKLATHWFTPRQFTLATGMALFVGVVGGVTAGVPLRALVEVFSWRTVMAASAIATAILTFAIWKTVRDDPKELGYTSHFPEGHAHEAGASIWAGIREVLSYLNVWLLMLTPIGVAGGILTFAGLWGVPYLTQVYGLDPKSAAAVTSTMLVAWALSGPIMGAWSERQGLRKPLYVVSTAIAMAGWSVLAFMPTLPIAGLVVLLVCIGLASGNLIIGFAYAKESVPARLMGTASGICNMGPLMGGMFLQPAVGWALDKNWSGALVNGARLYDLAAYQAGFLLIFSALAISLIAISFTRETHCTQKV